MFIGDSNSFVLNNIESELEIGTSLDIGLRLAEPKDFVKIDNSKDGHAYILIETRRETPDELFYLNFESFNTKSNVKSTLKTDTMRL